MVHFTTTILQFNEQGEKTGWHYIDVPADIAQQLKPGRKSFMVKGRLDDYPFARVSLLPMGNGRFIMPLKSNVRKAIRKGKGAMLQVTMEADDTAFEIPPWMMECLDDDPDAKAYFIKLPPSHQKYYIKWIESAKTEHTKTKRIALAVTAFSKQMDYGEMIRFNREQGW